jgi:hypothetical protein
MELRVDNSVRNRNKMAIERRDKWRRQYNELSRTIREVKGMRNLQTNTRFMIQIELESLRLLAHQMMLDRNKIKNELRDSAYTWV